jgi:murein DD-endopeptidase MepM/ murein hydrolase activator NlpD
MIPLFWPLSKGPPGPSRAWGLWFGVRKKNRPRTYGSCCPRHLQGWADALALAWASSEDPGRHHPCSNKNPKEKEAMKYFHTIALACWAASFAFAAPQRGDQDFDGVPDSQDPCPRSILSAEQLIPGCSCIDLMLYPEVAADPVLAAIEDMRDVLRERPELFNAEEALGSARYNFLVGLEFVRAADTAAAKQLLFVGLADMETAKIMLETFVAALQQQADDDFANPAGHGRPGTGAGTGPGGGASSGGLQVSPGSQVSRGGNMQNLSPVRYSYGDTDEASGELLYWQVRSEELSALMGKALDMLNLFDIMDSLSGPPVELFGRVAAVEDGMRLLRMDDGTEVVLPWDYVASDGLHLGQWIHINGHHVDDKFVGDTSDSAEPSPSPWSDPTLEICLQLRFAPRTALMTSGALKHDPAGYLEAGAYQLEQGMAISAEQAGHCAPLPTGGPNNEVQGILDSFEVKLSYTTLSWNAKTVTLASALTASSQPPFLPSDMNPGATATLTVVRNRQDYISNDVSLYSLISAPQVVGSTLYTLRVKNRGHYALFEYDRIAFTLEDDDSTGFDAAKFIGVSLAAEVNADSGTIQQSAWGFKIVNGLLQYGQIALQQPFAIRNSDFYPVWPSDGQPNEAWTGVSHPAGLEWPTVAGERNGMPFRYTSRLPKIVRDAISICGDPAGPADYHCYYRMPFKENITSTVSQGNYGSFTHKGSQQFAYDFVAPSGTPLVASRAGIVRSVQTNITVNCTDPGFSGSCPFFGNFVAVDHQDGTTAWYLHMIQQSAYVLPGDEVKRGDTLGLLGNTGNSTGAHVHFHVNSPKSSTTMPARFEFFLSPLMSFFTCAIPQKGWKLVSTNLP